MRVMNAQAPKRASTDANAVSSNNASTTSHARCNAPDERSSRVGGTSAGAGCDAADGRSSRVGGTSAGAGCEVTEDDGRAESAAARRSATRAGPGSGSPKTSDVWGVDRGSEPRSTAARLRPRARIRACAMRHFSREHTMRLFPERGVAQMRQAGCAPHGKSRARRIWRSRSMSATKGSHSSQSSRPLAGGNWPQYRHSGEGEVRGRPVCRGSTNDDGTSATTGTLRVSSGTSQTSSARREAYVEAHDQPAARDVPPAATKNASRSSRATHSESTNLASTGAKSGWSNTAPASSRGDGR